MKLSFWVLFASPNVVVTIETTTMKLHEIEIFAENPSQSGTFFQDLLQRSPKVDIPNLKVLDVGIPNIDFNISAHYPEFKVSLSFLTEDLTAVHTRLQEAGLIVSPIYEAHLGMKGFCLVNDGVRIVIHAHP